MANVPAYPNFKGTVISKKIEQELKGSLQALNFVNNDYQGEVGLGKTVRIIGVLRPTVKTYEQGTDIASAENVQDTSLELKIDQYKYINIGVDDIDQAATDIKVMTNIVQSAKDAFAVTADQYIMTLAGGHTNKSSSTVVTTGDQMIAMLDAGLVALWTAKVPLAEKVVAVLEPRVFSLAQNKIMALSTDNVELIKRGVFGMYKNCEVMMSNYVYNDLTNDCNIMTTKKAIAFADGINSTEAYRPEKQFKDAIKMLYTFGAKIVRPSELYVMLTKAS
jgi:hypothetical protein